MSTPTRYDNTVGLELKAYQQFFFLLFSYPHPKVFVTAEKMKTVLLVEDSLTDRNIMASYLQQAGLLVVSASSVEEAQEKLSHNKPDLIVLDVILPGQSGFEMCRTLKTNPETRKIPVIICSTKGTDVDKIWGNMLGADAYLIKPVNDAELQVTLKQCLG
ncbi:response regulator [Oscillatoria sp. FACHB-1406]|uniref:response regulator transcription factor n=1 Tax=Oscillatoria sp. FACHB-1406 TaxID=2692846 RepID=UPI0032202A34